MKELVEKIEIYEIVEPEKNKEDSKLEESKEDITKEKIEKNSKPKVLNNDLKEKRR